MAYLELSKEAYNDIINAAGMKGSKIARICELQGVWSEEAAAEDPGICDDEPDLGTQHVEELLEQDADADPLMSTDDD